MGQRSAKKHHKFTLSGYRKKRKNPNPKFGHRRKLDTSCHDPMLQEVKPALDKPNPNDNNIIYVKEEPLCSDNASAPGNIKEESLDNEGDQNSFLKVEFMAADDSINEGASSSTNAAPETLDQLLPDLRCLKAEDAAEEKKVWGTSQTLTNCVLVGPSKDVKPINYIKMDRFVTESSESGAHDRSRSLSGDSFRSSTPVSLSVSLSDIGHRHSNIIMTDSDIEPMSDQEANLSLQPTQPLEEETGEAGDQPNQAVINELKTHLESLESYFVFAKFVKTEEKRDGKYVRNIHSGKAKCVQPLCKTKGSKNLYSFTSQSRAHLKKHYENVHKAQLPQLAAAMEGHSKRGRSKSRDIDLPSKRRQLSLEESFSKKGKVTKEMVRRLYLRWFIETMSPLSLTEHPATRLLLAALKPDFDVPSRRTLVRDMDKAWEKARGDLINILYSQKTVATTADSWTAHNRAFLGMTVHWIAQDSLQRKKATLACKELKERQTHQLLGQIMSDIHQEFGLAGKVAATTTDNGANYCAVFRHYAADMVPLEVEPEEEDPEVVVGQPIDVQEQLGREGEAGIELPPHHRCSAHTVNLLATVDIAEVPGWNHGLMSHWKKAAGKAQGLWNLQNMSTVAANQIKAAVNRKLNTPVVTRWNSYYDSITVLLEVLRQPSHLEAINTIIINQPRGTKTPINEIDIKIFSEYKAVMDPVAVCLDRLQEEANAYMGILLPNLHIMKSHLERQRDSGDLQYATPLVEALLKGFDTRFCHLYEDREVLMATAIHPHYTPAVLRKVAPDMVAAIKDKLIRELKNSIKSKVEEEQPGPSAPWHRDLSEDPDVLDLFLDDDAPDRRQEELGEVLTKSMESWQRANTKTPVSRHFFPMEHREAWVDLFIKYNTPLPSSAAVERLFSAGGDIMRPKRASLTATNFEELVFMKGNMDLLGFKDKKEDMEEEEEEEEME